MNQKNRKHIHNLHIVQIYRAVIIMEHYTNIQAVIYYYTNIQDCDYYGKLT